MSKSVKDILAMITLLPSLPLFVVTDASVFLEGSWIEYMPNSFYIEMVPADKKTVSADFLRQLQIKHFALKMYPDMAAGSRETISAFAGLSRHSAGYIAELLMKNADPVAFAEAAAKF